MKEELHINMRMTISSLFVDFSLTMCQFSRVHHKEVVNMGWVHCGKVLKDRKVFLSVLGLNSQPRGCYSKSITTQPPHTATAHFRV